MRDSEFDILVLGGGPAGASTALMLLALHPGLRICVVEKGDYSQRKAGETIPPPTSALLQRLGIWEAFLQQDHLPSYGTQSAWGSAETHENEFIYNPHRQGWHLDRVRFDAWMGQQAAARGATLCVGTQLHSQMREGDGWQVELRQQGQRRQVTARWLVDATGRVQALSKSLGVPRLRYDRMTAVMAVIDCSTGIGHDVLVEAFERGWWYSALLPQEKMALAVFCDGNEARMLAENEAFAKALLMAPHTGKRLQAGLGAGWEKALAQAELHTWSASSQRLVQPCGDGWLAVGDAAATYDPLSSQGIFFALRSGIFGAYAIADALRGRQREGWDKFARAIADEYDHYLDTRTGFYEQERRWPQSHFWRIRQGQPFLNPNDHLQLRRSPTLKALHFTEVEYATLAAGFPDGAPAWQWVQEMQQRCPRMNANTALAALQSLVLDGLAEVESNHVAPLP